ncbi:S-adenosyl-L-methionine-dependent methyltransferase [Schizopora paradoxa]|uniref:S-adenosyl-L-methionine-dependent methyltransferase n=1 Tax=Schizopora paradoxa TaxID=27342 RepID=A0A0H2R2V3_9AGAM|nr:S-adenosyl-L-methionine-dependent methyltransferase [Schizopora paradoxa]
MTSTIRALAEVILQNIDALEADCARRGVEAPSMKEPFKPGSEFSLNDADVQKASTVIVAAAQQLINTVQPPQVNLVMTAYSTTLAGAIRVAAEFHIADILSEAGPAGLHVKDICSICKADPVKIGQVLRFLASAWIFQEVKPDVYSNNRNSSIMVKGLSVKELHESPETKYSKPEGSTAALLGIIGDETIKGASYLYETLSDPKTAFSGEANEAPLCKALNTDLSCWQLYEQPEQQERQHRFGVAMQGISRLEPIEVTTKGFDWSGLKKDAVVVDVGGGIGSFSLALAKEHPQVKFVVQDRGPVVEDGLERAKVFFPEGVDSGRLSFQEHNFFESEPIKNADVYMLKFIIHDWSNKYSHIILKRLREAAAPHSRLIIVDKIIPYICPPSEVNEDVSVPGVWKPELPEPIVNMSGGIIYPHLSSVVMMLWCNGQERTIGDFNELLAEAGWKLEQVHQHDAFGQNSSQIIAVPI